MATREVPWNSRLRDLEEGIPNWGICVSLHPFPPVKVEKRMKLEYEVSYKI